MIYDIDIVPVGAHQRHHVQYAREAAVKFNNAFGETFREPKEKIMAEVGVAGTDGKKMSKSYKNTIPLFASKDEIAKAVMSIVTDSKGESPEHVYNIHSHFRTRDELSEIYTTNKGNYKALKEALIEDMEALISPMREKRNSITDDEIKQIIKDGGERARAIASAKMTAVRSAVGVTV